MVAPAGTGPEPPHGADRAQIRQLGDQDGDVRDRRRLGWRGLGLAGLSFVGGMLVSALLAGSYAVARGLDEEEVEGDLAFALLGAVGTWVGFLVLPILWALRHGGPARHLGLTGRWVDLPLGIVVGLSSTIVTALVSVLVLTSGEQEKLESIAMKQVDRAQGAVAVVLLFTALCVVTPVAEEVFFRGLLLRSLHRVAGVVVALVGMALVFGLLHYGFEPMPGKVVAVQLGLLSLFGIVLGALSLRTGRLGASIVAHATFNAVTVVSLLAER